MRIRKVTQQDKEALYQIGRLSQSLANLCTAGYCLEHAASQAEQTTPADAKTIERLREKVLAIARKWSAVDVQDGPCKRHIEALGLKYGAGRYHRPRPLDREAGK